jgi:hypothetical protein
MTFVSGHIAAWCCWQYLQDSLASSIVSTCMLELCGYPKQSLLGCLYKCSTVSHKALFQCDGIRSMPQHGNLNAKKKLKVAEGAWHIQHYGGRQLDCHAHH